MPLQKYHKDLCPYQFSIGIEEEGCYYYEITITFNPQIWTHASAYNKGVPLIKEKLIEWLSPYRIDKVYFVIEYTKAHFPHMHICVVSSVELPPDIRSNMVKGMQRLFGRSCFKDVINVESFESYLEKDLKVNYEKSGIPHYELYCDY